MAWGGLSEIAPSALREIQIHLLAHIAMGEHRTKILWLEIYYNDDPVLCSLGIRFSKWGRATIIVKTDMTYADMAITERQELTCCCNYLEWFSKKKLDDGQWKPTTQTLEYHAKIHKPCWNTLGSHGALWVQYIFAIVDPYPECLFENAHWITSVSRIFALGSTLVNLNDVMPVDGLSPFRML